MKKMNKSINHLYTLRHKIKGHLYEAITKFRNNDLEGSDIQIEKAQESLNNLKRKIQKLK